MKENRKLLTAFISGTLLAGAFVFLYMNHQNQSRLDHFQLLTDRQAVLIDSVRYSGLGNMVAYVLDKIEHELENNPKRVLTDETISSIASLCYIAKPYVIPDGDSLTARKVSPERGQLLLFLFRMNLDSISKRKIVQAATFAEADLHDADLSYMDLRGINLKGGYLKGANLTGADVSKADLSFSNLWGAHLRGAKLNDTNLKRSDLSWADLNDAELISANLHEADLISAQLRKANLRGSNLQWTDFSGAFLNEADLANSDMFRATFKRAQLRKANLSSSILTYAILSEADLTETILTGADLANLIIAEAHWLDFIVHWKVAGAEAIRKQYKIMEAFSYEGSRYQLTPMAR